MHRSYTYTHLAELAMMDGDISQVIVRVESVPTLTFVPVLVSEESIDSPVSGYTQPIAGQTSLPQHDKMQSCRDMNEPPVGIIIEDYDTVSHLVLQDTTQIDDDDLNNNVEFGEKPLEQQDNSQVLPLFPIDEEFHPSENSGHLDLEIAGDTLTPNELEKIKGLARRLNLQTRRGSYTTWRARLMSSLSKHGSPDVACGKADTDTPHVVEPAVNRSDDEKLKEGPSERMTKALSHIRAELMELREMDESLARQFICIRNGIQKLKLENTQQEYNDMVDDAQCTIAENVQFESVCDEPRTLDKSPLLTLGITKMNLTERRFSVF